MHLVETLAGTNCYVCKDFVKSLALLCYTLTENHQLFVGI